MAAGTAAGPGTMNILHRHIVREFLVPLLYCAGALVLVFVIYDLFDNLPDFVRHQVPGPAILRYYLMLMPNTVVVILPWSLLLAILYEMAWFTRNHEITAVRSSGISLLSFTRPLVVVGLLCSLVSLGLNELVVPASLLNTERFIRLMEHPDEPPLKIIAVLAFRNRSEGRTWLVRNFDPDKGTTGEIEVSQTDPTGRKLWTIRSRTAHYLDGRWWFFRGVYQPYDDAGLPDNNDKVLFAKREMRSLAENPRHFLNIDRVEREPERLSSAELLSYLQMRGGTQDDKTRAAQTMLHYRLATPWTCLMVVLIGIPCGVRTTRRGAALGVAAAIGVVAGYFFAVQTSFVLGKEGAVPPAAAGWGACLLFSLLGAGLLWKAR